MPRKRRAARPFCKPESENPLRPWPDRHWLVQEAVKKATTEQLAAEATVVEHSPDTRSSHWPHFDMKYEIHFELQRRFMAAIEAGPLSSREIEQWCERLDSQTVRQTLEWRAWLQATSVRPVLVMEPRT